MFKNLNAEQARIGMSDEQVAKFLGISRQLYGKKKQFAKFTLSECKKLMKLFNATFDYLFAETQNDTLQNNTA